ncbi:MAG: DUF378 domain-containing protein [Chloroflexi bacterium]|nr:DUF378 domain-containing protein [Chloroflexota bacterium]
METLQLVALIVAAIGAINWGLVGLARIDLVALIAGGLKFGEVNSISRVLYIVVGLAGALAIVLEFTGGNGA